MDKIKKFKGVYTKDNITSETTVYAWDEGSAEKAFRHANSAEEVKIVGEE